MKQNQPILHETLARLCAEHRPFDSHETVDRRRRQEHWLVEVFDTAGQLDPEWQPLIACVARVSRLTFEKDTRSGLWPSREEIGCYACQIRLDADARALTGVLKIAIITFGMWARMTAGSGKVPARWPASAPPPSTFCAPKVSRTSAKPSTSTPSTSTTCSRSALHDQN